MPTSLWPFLSHCISGRHIHHNLILVTPSLFLSLCVTPRCYIQIKQVGRGAVGLNYNFTVSYCILGDMFRLFATADFSKIFFST